MLKDNLTHHELDCRGADVGFSLGHSSLEGRQPDASDITLAISRFPSTRYYGSKRRLLPWIYEALKDLRFETALDAFGGTGSVSLLLLAMGKHVSFHDGLQFNALSAEALLSKTSCSSDMEVHFNRFIDKIRVRNGFISSTFKGMYYTDEENAWLDGAATALHKVELGWWRSTLFHCLFQACLMKRPFNLFHRANLNLRLRKVERSFHNHVTWETSFPVLMKRIFLQIDKNLMFHTGQANILSCGNVDDLEAGYDLVYLDPPYISLERSVDDYLRRYHFLEGLADYSNWNSLIDPTSPIKAVKPRPHIREWQDKRFFRERLFDLASRHRKSIVVLSYIADSYPTEAELHKNFKQLFGKVRVYTKPHNHVLAKSKKQELLIVGEPKK